MDSGRISVIVPCYNIEKYIERTVRSILDQSYENLEIILVDDGSTDGTPEINDRLAMEQTRIHSYHKENGGVSSARLYGIDRAEGDWITFVDGDDLLKPEMYFVLIGNAIKNKADISHCGYEMVFPNHIDRYYGTGKTLVQTGTEGLRDLLTGDFVEPGLCNKIYRKELVLEAREECGKFPGIHYMEDLLWNYYFFKRSSRSVYVDNCYYQYVLRKGSAALSEVTPQKLMDPVRVFRIIEQDILLLAREDTSHSAEHTVFHFKEKRTFYSRELVTIVRQRKASVLINMASMDTKGMSDRIIRCSSKAKAFLLKNRRHYLAGHYSRTIKMKVMLVTALPGAYHMIHKVYQIMRGTYKKYD